jgi:hypothetical protein
MTQQPENSQPHRTKPEKYITVRTHSNITAKTYQSEYKKLSGRNTTPRTEVRTQQPEYRSCVEKF